MNYLLFAILAIIGYLLGSVNAAVILTKYFLGKDVRTQGSGNAGATNVTRTFGWGAGAATLASDMIKTFLSALIGYYLFSKGAEGMCAALFGCSIGHCFPVYFRFKGGKGISVGFAIGLCLCPAAALIGGLLIWFIIVFLCKRVSAASLAGCIGIPVAYFIIHGAVVPQLPLLIFSAVLIIFMHRGNIKRLVTGTEPPFHAKSKKDGNNN